MFFYDVTSMAHIRGVKILNNFPYSNFFGEHVIPRVNRDFLSIAKIRDTSGLLHVYVFPKLAVYF